MQHGAACRSTERKSETPLYLGGTVRAVPCRTAQSDTLNPLKEYSKQMLTITNMANTKLLFFFLDGLQPWTNKNLVGCNVKNLNSAITLVEKQPEYERADQHHSKPTNKAKGVGTAANRRATR